MKNYIYIIVFLALASFSFADQVDTNSITTDVKNKQSQLTKEELLNQFNARTAVVDVDQILENSDAIKGIKKAISKISSNIQSELSEKEIKLKKTEEDLIKQRGVIDEALFKKRIAEFNKNVSEVQQEMQKKKAALERANANAISEVHRNTIAIIAELSQKYYFNIVLPKSQALYVREDLDITEEVVEELNKKLKQVEVEYKVDIE